MGGVSCDICKKTFKTNILLDKHKPSCEAPSFVKYEQKCLSCSKLFSSQATLIYHVKTQHNKLKTYDEQNNTKQNTNNFTQYITNNITNIDIGKIDIGKISNKNTNINIQPVLFVKHGEERIDHITKEFLLKLLDNPSSQKMFIDLMSTLYFSDEVPENNNWTLVYPYNTQAAVVFDYDQNKFVRNSNEQIINDKFSNMIDKIVPMIDEINEDKDNLTRNQQLNIAHFYDKECMYELSKSCPDIYELIRKLAYEKRFTPMKTWKDSGFDGKHLSISFDKKL